MYIVKKALKYSVYIIFKTNTEWEGVMFPLKFWNVFSIALFLAGIGFSCLSEYPCNVQDVSPIISSSGTFVSSGDSDYNFLQCDLFCSSS